MTTTAVLLARAIAFLDTNELSPRGTVFFPNLVSVLRERFNFQAFPSKPEDFDESKGVKFSGGFFDGHTIDELTIFNDGIVLSLRSSTSHAKQIIHDTLTWLAENHGVTYNERIITRWNFVSNLAFNAEVDLNFINPAFVGLINALNTQMKGDLRVTPEGFHVESVSFDVDRTFGAKQLVPFKIERRKNVPYSEGKYFSAAPLATDVHIALIQQFEDAIGK